MDPAGVETKFQLRERLYDVWEREGCPGEPPERPVFRSTEHGISAMVDPFSAWDLGVVIYPHEAHRGQDAHLWELPPSRFTKLQLVAQAVGNRILKVVRDQDATAGLDGPAVAQRALARVDGFALPDHPHIVLGAAERGASPMVWPEDPGARTSELDKRWRLLQLPDPLKQHLLSSLNLVANSAPLMDALFYQSSKYGETEAEYPQTSTPRDLARILLEADEALRFLSQQSQLKIIGRDADGAYECDRQQAVLVAGLADRLAAYKSTGAQVSYDVEAFIVRHSSAAQRSLERAGEPIYYMHLNFMPFGSNAGDPSTLQTMARRLIGGAAE